MIQKILNIKTRTVGLASLILMGSYLASAALGLLRDRLLAGKFGAGNELDVYYAAFVVPDLIALLLILGAASSAVIPIFNSYLAKSKEDAFEYVSNLLNVFLVFLIAVCLIFIIFAPYFIFLIAPGFSEAKKADATALARIMFLSPIILGISNIISGLLQVFHKFLATALAPIMYNGGIIFGILFLVPVFGITGLAWGVVLGGFLHLLTQALVFFRSGFRFRKIFQPFHPGILKTFRLMAPRSLGLAAGQLNTVAITAIASTLSVGTLAVFNLANNLSSILTNAVAVSLSTAVFPSMSAAYSVENKEDFQKKFSGAFGQIMFLAIPASLLIFLTRAQIVRIILGSGKFGWLDTRLTAACLGVFSISLLAQGMIFLLSKTFYALHNTKIPAIISGATVVFNILMSLLFVRLIAVFPPFAYFLRATMKLQGIENISVLGIALAFAITMNIEAILLLFFLLKKSKIFEFSEIIKSFVKILTATIGMGIAAIITRQIVSYFANMQSFLGVFSQFIATTITGVIVYIVISLFLNSRELKTIKESFFNLCHRKT